MKTILSKVMILLSVFTLVMGVMTSFGINPSYADNLRVIGNNIGLVVDPSGTSLFNLTNMNPGDVNEAKVEISNKLEYKFALYMRTERVSLEPEAGEADLFNQLVLTINYDGDEIYKGPMADFARSNFPLGTLKPGDDKELNVVVYLPGPETGNEFQGKFVEVRWIFIAEQRPNDPPEDIDEPDRPEKEKETTAKEEDIPLTSPEIVQPEVIAAEEEIPLMIPILPRTGLIPAGIYYALSIVLLGFWISIKRGK